jgi:hypothetical protein
MTITEQDIKNLTPEHRVVWKDPNAPREVEMGLWVDKFGRLWTDAGHVMRWGDGGVPAFALDHIVRIIEPTLTPPGPVARGLAQSAAGDVVDLGEFTQYVSEEDQSGERVKPSVEDVARVLCQPRHRDYDGWPLVGIKDYCGKCLDQARAVLALLPGRTEAEVKAEALREAAGPTLEIQAWNATPEEADAIFTAAMDAAYDAAPESVAVDAVGRLAGGAARGGTDE